jgi:hypothetical protein
MSTIEDGMHNGAHVKRRTGEPLPVLQLQSVLAGALTAPIALSIGSTWDAPATATAAAKDGRPTPSALEHALVMTR